MEQKSLDSMHSAELAQTLSSALAEAEEICGVTDQIERLEYYKNCLINHKSDYKSFKIFLLVFFTLGQFIMWLFTYESSVGTQNVCIVIDVVVLFISGFIARAYGEAKSHERAGRIQEIDASIESLNARRDRAYKDHSVMFFTIPEDYRFPIALNTMLGYLNNMRESTWRGCANRFEVEKRHDRSEELQRQILQSSLATQEYAKRIEWNTFWDSARF